MGEAAWGRGEGGEARTFGRIKYIYKEFRETTHSSFGWSNGCCAWDARTTCVMMQLIRAQMYSAAPNTHTAYTQNNNLILDLA